MDRELLEKEFESEQIKTRKGNYGKDIDYIETAPVIQRLNDALDGSWSFDVVDYIIKDNDVAILGKLSTNGDTKMQWGSRKIGKNRKTGEIINIGDDLKAATSDCLKKTASLLGCGLHIYTDDDLMPQQPSTNKSDEKITQEQLAEVKKLRTELNWEPEKVQEYSKQMFQSEVTEINPTMAQAFIAFLKTQLDSKTDKADKEEKQEAPADEPLF